MKKKLKIKPIKNKKLLIVLIVLASILLVGLLLNFSKKYVSEEMHKVTINYCFVDCNKNVVDNKRYENEFPSGEHINIPTPVEENYLPDKENIIAVVNSDLVFNVTYECAIDVNTNCFEYAYTDDEHYINYLCNYCGAFAIKENVENHLTWHEEEIVIDNAHYLKKSCFCGYYTLDNSDYHNLEVLSIEKYPTSSEVGLYTLGCSMCSYISDSEEFTTLTQTVEFGGEAINRINSFSTSFDGYLISGNDGKLVKLANSVPEFTFLENGGVHILNGNTLNPKINVTLEYDESVWGENAIIFKRNINESVDTKYSVAIGNNYRVMFDIEDRSDFPTWLTWLQDENCPLAISPIRLIVSYDFN